MNGSKRTAVKVIDSLNSGDTALVKEISTVPFIFDGEIIVSGSSVSKIWTGLANAGFTVTNPEIISISPVVSEDFALFRSSWEMEVFFKNKIPQYTYKIKMEGVESEVLMLINKGKSSTFNVMGLKADVK
jgi:hypothetical protein